MAYKPDQRTKLCGIIGVALLIAMPVAYLLYRIAIYA
jgi:hypothetical protein